MKIVHIESGLGNQMLEFAQYLLLKKLNPNEKIYIEKIIYEIPECSEVVCQWNGFELDKIFHVEYDDIKDIFTEEQWEKVVEYVRNSKFWENNWDYSTAIVEALASQGCVVENGCEKVEFIAKPSLKSRLTNNYIGYTIKRWLRPFYQEKYIQSMATKEDIFIQDERDLFLGNCLKLAIKNVNIEYIDAEIREAFTFPEITDERNAKMVEYLRSVNSVAIHARRGDMLRANGYCYKYGFFKRSVKYIKKHVDNPVFVFFCDPGSMDWCRENEAIFGLNFNKDTIIFVEWNSGEDSFRDMQLMAECKHQIITNSSFGWWGAYLNTNPDKITCSSSVWYNTTHTF